ncbi:SH3 domain-containing protein [Alcanivorax sp.]|jgi:uncharacterized protein YgiM (DUF1202 family)|uniref:SH3 domain-containing protein n=1 Tax=Alcanivorax sp. TaxID=1872427 RepID=UPI0032D907E7
MGGSGNKGFKGISGLVSELDSAALKDSMHQKSAGHQVSGVDGTSVFSDPQTSTASTKPREKGAGNSNQPGGESKDDAAIAMGIAIPVVIFVILGLATFVNENPVRSPEPPQEKVVVYGEPFHVTATVLNVRSAPSPTSPVIDTLSKGENIYGSRNMRTKTDGWRQIQFGALKGWVSTFYLKRGTAEQARVEQCKATSTRPFTGQIFNQRGSGYHSLVVKNGPNEDVIAKLKDKSGEEIISFYVRANETATLKNIPGGYFKFQFATGKYYSSECGGKFMEGMRVSEDPNYVHYETTIHGHTRYSSIMQYTLTQVRGGNLKMKNVPSGRF